jgi:hypothetical protein
MKGKETLSESTALTLLRNWDSPTHFFPMGMVANIGYFSKLLGMTSEEFIQQYEDSLFVGWFKIK